MTKRGLTLLALDSMLAMLAACSSNKSTTKQEVSHEKYDVAPVDTLHGTAFPYTFDRALELRKAQQFEAAGYIYINLYPNNKDSVVAECSRMGDEIKLYDSTRSLPYILGQALGTQSILDREVMPSVAKYNPQAMSVRHKWCGDLINDLYYKGYR